ncbi:HCP-like superfamily protein with MYND-type zinc finger [Heracleum sosnowskyi]|uniref:HCP-like superfamily protein with MYND-type zinc finger n=1 Tax=Heracleum sosnowskyi TaxID=360622 RepID=A0AAD8H1G7_9APIA|nr:HCP-like superfamily protein with MYND-type zinc finger [Heracleum sosnowskyi]
MVRNEEEMACRKKARISSSELDFFESLPDDILSVILSKLSSSASSPSDFINALLTCTRMNKLGLQPAVLKHAGMNTVAVRAKNWSDSAERFLRLCVDAGSNEASYLLGMIRFYCLRDTKNGKDLIHKAAIEKHAPALYSLAIILFNGSGGSKETKNIRTACTLSALAAELGSIDALRELGYCFQDGYGLRKSLPSGQTLLIQAAALEVACTIRASPGPLGCESQLTTIMSLKTFPSANPGLGRAYWSETGFEMSPREKHPANRFLVEWFENGSGRVGLSMCSDMNCGRPETREKEFRKCAGCGDVKYCSRGCQAHDWKVRHKMECSHMPRLFLHHAVDGDLDLD